MQLTKDPSLLSELFVAEKLSKTLVELREAMTEEELALWLMFYEIRADEEEKAMNEAKRRRR